MVRINMFFFNGGFLYLNSLQPQRFAQENSSKQPRLTLSPVSYYYYCIGVHYFWSKVIHTVDDTQGIGGFDPGAGARTVLPGASRVVRVPGDQWSGRAPMALGFMEG